MSILGSKPLAGQTTLILGGSGAMGAAAAGEIMALGGTVVLVGRREQHLADNVEQLGKAASFLIADVGNDVELEGLFGPTRQFDHIVVAVSANASASSIQGTVPSQAQRAFSRFWISYAVLHQAPDILPASGSITLLSGSSARTPAAGFGVWTALHGSIEALARAAAVDLAPIRVNVVSPGGIGMAPDRQLLERPGTPPDVGAAIAMCVANSAMTGAVIDVDSGERKGHWSG